MGWRSWNAFKADISQDLMLEQVKALAQRRKPDQLSLLELGYGRIGIDDGWQACGAGVNGSFHNASGYPIVNKTIFPDMKAMNDEAQKHGAAMGWYGNNCGCAEHQFDKSG